MNNILKFLLLIPLIIASDDVVDISEISYGSDEKQRIDLYIGTSDKVLVWIHGGGWLYGDKRAERWIKRFQNHFVDHENFNVYMIGYRLGKATAPSAVDDVICAYKKIISDASQRNFSTEDIVVAGASAGGHLALMVGLSDNYENNECVQEIAPKAIINIFGITEIKQTLEFLDKTKFFDASNYVKGWIGPDANIDLISKTLSPINLLDEIDLNVLTIHGTNDRWVPYEQALLLEQKLGNQHQLLTIDGGGHYYFSEEEDEIIRDTISSFLNSNFNMSTREQQD
jgi:acetyl esterase/lipase